MPAAARLGVTEAYTARSGSPLYVEQAGDGPPVLALHGLGGGAWFFSGLLRRLPSYRVLAVDLPGTGRSTARGGHEGPAALDPDSWVSDLGGLVADRVRQPVVIVGHSMGTILGLKAWAAWPEWIRAFVFVGGLPHARPAVGERLAQRETLVAEHGMRGTGALVSTANFSRATLSQNPELVALFERVFEAQDPAAYIACCRILRTIAADEIVASVRVPCLAITGAEDQYAPPGLVQAFLDQVPGDRRAIVLEDAGHFPFLEVPERFAGALASFLDRVCYSVRP